MHILPNILAFFHDAVLESMLYSRVLQIKSYSNTETMSLHPSWPQSAANSGYANICCYLQTFLIFHHLALGNTYIFGLPLFSWFTSISLQDLVQVSSPSSLFLSNRLGGPYMFYYSMTAHFIITNLHLSPLLSFIWMFSGKE